MKSSNSLSPCGSQTSKLKSKHDSLRASNPQQIIAKHTLFDKYLTHVKGVQYRRFSVERLSNLGC